MNTFKNVATQGILGIQKEPKNVKTMNTFRLKSQRSNVPASKENLSHSINNAVLPVR